MVSHIEHPQHGFREWEEFARILSATVSGQVGWKGEGVYPFAGTVRESYHVGIVPDSRISLFRGADEEMSLVNNPDGSLTVVCDPVEGMGPEDAFSMAVLSKVSSSGNIASLCRETYGGKRPVDCLVLDNGTYVFGCDSPGFRKAVDEFFRARTDAGEPMDFEFLSEGGYRRERREYLDRHAVPGPEDYGMTDNVFFYDGRTLFSQGQVQLPGGAFLSEGERFGYFQKLSEMEDLMASVISGIQSRAGIDDVRVHQFKDALYLSKVTSGDRYGIYSDYGRRCHFSIRPDGDGFWIRDEEKGRNFRAETPERLRLFIESRCCTEQNIGRMRSEDLAYRNSVRQENRIEQVRRRPRRTQGISI